MVDFGKWPKMAENGRFRAYFGVYLREMAYLGVEHRTYRLAHRCVRILVATPIVLDRMPTRGGTAHHQHQQVDPQCNTISGM